MTTMMAPATLPQTLNHKQLNHLNAWREVWLDHVYWTRLVETGIVHDVPGLDQTVNRLLRNVDDMLALMTPYYGQSALEPFRALLTDHLKIAAKLVTEAKQRSPDAEQTERVWFQNADDISSFLSKANPNLAYDDVRRMFFDHLEKTKAEAVYMLQGQWDQDIANWEKIESMGLMMADAFGTATIAQFPEQFS